jgi:pimeloyl-ACP methyl ester carboxylesterase
MDTQTIDTPRLAMHCWVQGPPDGEPLLLIHGNLVTGRFWQGVAERLPKDRFRVVAPDLRSFGRTERRGIDATRGLRDWSDDLRSLVEVLGWADGHRIHAAGWSMGGGVLQQYELDHPDDLASLTLVAPLSPYGFGSTKDAVGTLTFDDAAGSGGGAAAPEFVRRLAAGDASEDDPASSPRVTMRNFFWSPKYQAPDENELIAEVLLTAVGDEYYPGDAVPSPNWPTVAPGRTGVNNAMAPIYCNTSAFGDVEGPVPLLWIRGDEDQVVSDESMFDFGNLGRIGAVPGWPGMEVFPPQPAVSQTRAVFDRRRPRGVVREVVLAGVGHGPVIEAAGEVATLMLEHIDAAKPEVAAT